MIQLRSWARAADDDDVEEQQLAVAMPEVAARLDRAAAVARCARVKEKRGGEWEIGEERVTWGQVK